MTTDWEEKAILAELREQQRQREMIARYAPQTPRKCLLLERLVTQATIPRLTRFGPVNLTVHSAPFDLWVGGCRVELKAANWTANQGKAGRYQGTIRNRQADVLLFVAVNGQYHYFVIPMSAVGRRRQIAISSYRVSDYQGQWAAYLEAWEVLAQAVASAPARPLQTSF